MISRFGSKGFFADHYEWLAIAVGVIVLAFGVWLYFDASGVDPDEAANEQVRALANGRKNMETGVASADMSALRAAIGVIKHPMMLADISDEKESFLASEHRVVCGCGMVLPGDGKDFPKCPKCGKERAGAKVEITDADGDGLPDVWEKRYGLNPEDAADANLDMDGDEFTNLEEFVAKTDPTDRASHPDYINSVRLELPLKETYMPFILIEANKIPSGWRCQFFDAKQRDDYGRAGRKIPAEIGAEVGNSGYMLKAFTPKTEKRTIKGSQNHKDVDVSEAELLRKSDGKIVTLVMSANKKAKPIPVDVQAVLVYERIGAKRFEVVKGSEIVLSGTKYRVEGINSSGKKTSVVISNVNSGKKHIVEALEQ